MNSEFIPYEQALTLKELGFDEPCLAFRDFDYHMEIGDITKNSSWSSEIVSIPLYQQAFRWLRKEYGLVHDIKPVWVSRPIKEKYEYTIYFHSKTGRSYVTGSGSSESIDDYRETEIVCLEEMIKEAKKLKNGNNIYH